MIRSTHLWCSPRERELRQCGTGRLRICERLAERFCDGTPGPHAVARLAVMGRRRDGVAGPELADLRQRHGVVALPSQAGIAAFVAALSSARRSWWCCMARPIGCGKALVLRRRRCCVRNAEIAMPAVLRRQPEHEPIAAIGSGGPLSGRRDLEEFWRNLAAGVDSRDRGAGCALGPPGVFRCERRATRDQLVALGRVHRRRGSIRSAVLQHLAARGGSDGPAGAAVPADLLCRRWRTPATRASAAGWRGGRVGVFAGVMTRSTSCYGGGRRRRGSAAADVVQSGLGGEPGVAISSTCAGRAWPVDTMCSASLTAIHLACEQPAARGVRAGARRRGEPVICTRASTPRLSRLRCCRARGGARASARAAMAMCRAKGSARCC